MLAKCNWKRNGGGFPDGCRRFENWLKPSGRVTVPIDIRISVSIRMAKSVSETHLPENCKKLPSRITLSGSLISLAARHPTFFVVDGNSNDLNYERA